MKLSPCLAMIFLLVSGSASPANDTTSRDDLSLSDQEQQKLEQVRGRPDPQGLVVGEDIPNAIPIPGLPFTGSGNTCDFVNDYDEACPYAGSTSPDVVYSYAPPHSQTAYIDLCNSDYDTKLYVYADSEATLVACNDDACGSDGFRSELIAVPLSTPNTYYIVVDGYGGDCGPYDLQIYEGPPPCTLCPPSGILEGEPDCYDGYVDAFNGGCNSSPPIFSSIPCSPSVVICGRYGGFVQSGFNYRDTDWYELPEEINVGNTLFQVIGSRETLMGYVDADLGCDWATFEEYVITSPCFWSSLEVPAGNKWLFVATADFGPSVGPCGVRYLIWLEGLECGPISIEPATWGELKQRYR